MTSKQTEMGK